MQMAGDLAVASAVGCGSWRNATGRARAIGEGAADAVGAGRDRGCRRSRSSRGRAAARQACAVGRASRAGPPPSWKLSPSAITMRGRIARDEPRPAAPASLRYRRAAAARRARRKARSFFEMQIGDRRAGPPPARRARPSQVGNEGDGGDGDRRRQGHASAHAPLQSSVRYASASAPRSITHRIASFTSSSAASASSVSAASP